MEETVTQQEYLEFIRGMLCPQAEQNAKVHAQLLHAAIGLNLELEEFLKEVEWPLIVDEASDVEFFLTLLEDETCVDEVPMEDVISSEAHFQAIYQLTPLILDAACKFIFQNREAKWTELQILTKSFRLKWEVHKKSKEFPCLHRYNMDKLAKRHGGKAFNQKLTDKRDRG